MIGTEFHDQAKGFADALLASRTATILDYISQEKGYRITPDEIHILRMAQELLSSSLAGRRAAQGETGAEVGFLDWMENLRHYETAFDAIVRSRLAAKDTDIERTLDSAKNKLEDVLSGSEELGQLDDLVRLFNSISEVNLDVVQDDTETAPQELTTPEELEVDAM